MHSLWTLLLILDLVTVNSRFLAREEKLVEALHVERLLERHLQEERASVIGFADPEVCYPALSDADVDGDQMVTADEYVSFCQDMGPANFLTDASSFEDLPLLLQSNFIALACLCQTDPDDDSCCVGENAAIRADGSYADEVPTPAEESYLFIVCSLTVSSVERVLASSPPSANPTSEPSSSPTSLPSRNPSVSPTDPATLDPTETPSEIPTQSPITLSPTVPPGVPTASPSSTPTSTPTTAIPTRIPTPAPTGQPTTATPTEAPIPNSIPVSVFYDIGVRPDAEQSRYIQELEDAMDVLSADVLESIPLGRRILQGRRLQSLRLPTDATVIQDIECPASSQISSEDFCQAVFASIVLIFLPDFESQEFSDRFSQALQGQIASGELTDALNRLHPETQIYILDDDTLDQGGGDGGNGDSISGGGVAGIVVGALALVAVVGLFAARRGPTKDDEVESLDPVPLEKDMEPFDPMGTLGAVTADYGKGLDAMMDNDEALNNMSLDSSSNAGSSGWSSSAGVSSLNTGEDDSYNQISAFGSTLRALGMNTIEGQPNVSSRDVPKGPGVTRADLDSAIEQGDWAAVGATAALLAAASDSQSFSSHNMSATVSRSESSSLDAARAAELDQLVESGDWEGVVLAAAKYEAGTDSASGSGSGASQSSTTQESRSTRKMAEYRQEVVDLVRRVVPEESPNVDEMMQQFRGREEELVETLRTMEERAVAQKAKDATQHQAKIQAKQKTQEQRAADATALLSYMRSPDTDDSFQEGASPSVVRSLGSGQVSATAQSLGTGEIEGGAKSKSLGTGEFADGRGKKHNALEEAIEAGDWEAVGEAAAMLSDHSLASSVETDEINRLADGLSSQGSASSKGNLSEQAEELEQLIERGDWTGVVDVAAGKSLGTSKQKALAEATRRQRRIKQRKHEDDALTGAHIWDAIAEQTQEETGTDNSDQAARNAADWAIGRSLSALVQAEEGNRLTREDSALGDSRHDTLAEEEV